MTDYNGATTFTYDDWGRTATEVKNGVTKTYSWTMANMLAGVDSDDPNDTDVAYTYRGDLKRIWRWEDGDVLTNYNWDAGFNVVSEEDIGTPTTLARTYIAGLAEIIGSNPATGTPRYLTHDHLGSTRGVFDGSKASLGAFEYTPYGNPYAFSGPADITRLFTGHDLDPLTGNYYAPFRYLNPNAGRWLKMDPWRMVDGPNMYGYVGGNPTNAIDPTGRNTLAIGGAVLCIALLFALVANQLLPKSSQQQLANDLQDAFSDMADELQNAVQSRDKPGNHEPDSGETYEQSIEKYLGGLHDPGLSKKERNKIKQRLKGLRKGKKARDEKKK